MKTFLRWLWVGKTWRWVLAYLGIGLMFLAIFDPPHLWQLILVWITAYWSATGLFPPNKGAA